MSKAIVVAAIAALTLFQAAPSSTTRTLVFTSPGRVTEAVTADGQRYYYVRNISELRFYDRRTKRDTLILGGLGNRSDLAISRDGHRLAFVKGDQDGASLFVWTLSLDPRTGLPSAPARRVSLTNATDPSFSPDGRSIAFHAPQTGRTLPERQGNLVVVPTVGGPERVVARTRGWVWPSQWTSDGKTIYFGLNIDDAAHTRESGIYRVPSSGGTPEFVAATQPWNMGPGLSLDGRLLIHFSERGDSVFSRTVDGKRLASFALPGSGSDWFTWYSATRGFDYWTRSPSKIIVRDLESGATRAIGDSAEYLNSWWSFDGRSVAYLATNRQEIVIVGADGTNRRALPTRSVNGLTLFWSPVGATIGYIDENNEVGVINVASGSLRALGRTTRVFDPKWRSDGGAILVASVDSQRAPDSTSVITVHELLIDGSRRVAGTTRAYCGQSWACHARFANDSQIVTWSARGEVYHVRNFRHSVDRVLLRREQAGTQPVPVLSRNGQWVVIRERDGTGEHRRIHVVRLDGSMSKTITVPFNVTQGAFNPLVSNDGKELIVSAAQIGQLDTVRVHRVNVETGQSTRLFDTSRQIINVSPTWRQAMYKENLPQFTEFWDVDASKLARGPSKDH